MKQPYLTRWRKLFSSATFATITPDLTPFYLGRALPPYLPIVADQVDTHTGPDYEILREGALDSNMPAHSGRQELAPYPDWTARYLVHKNPLQREFVLVNGDLSGGWPVHVRERENAPANESGVGPSGRSPWISDRTCGSTTGLKTKRCTQPRTTLTMFSTTCAASRCPICEYGLIPCSPGEDPGDPNFPTCISQGISRQAARGPDYNAHQPSIAYVPYLLTGDFYYAEEMAFWANYSMMRLNPVNPADGGTRGSLGILENQETRGYAWALRNLADAAANHLDLSPVKPYLSERVTANLQWLDGYVNGLDLVTNPFNILWLGYRGEQDAGYIALWEQNYLAYAIDRANQQGFIGGLDHRDAIAKLQLSLFTSEPGLSAFHHPRGRRHLQ